MLESFPFRRDLSPPRGTPHHPTQAAQRRSLRRSRAPPSGGLSPSDPSSRDCRISVLEASRGRAVAASNALPSGRRPPRHSVAATATLPATDLPAIRLNRTQSTQVLAIVIRGTQAFKLVPGDRALITQQSDSIGLNRTQVLAIVIRGTQAINRAIKLVRRPRVDSIGRNRLRCSRS